MHSAASMRIILYVICRRKWEHHENNGFTTEQPDCCQVGDYLEVEENQLPTSYWYMLEHAYGASTNYKNRERLQTRRGKVTKIWKDDRFTY